MAIIKKGLMGTEDFYSGTDTTFTRVNSTGGTNTLTRFGAAPQTFDTITVGKQNNIRFVDGVKFTTIQAAHDDLTAAGGRIVVTVALTVTGVTTISKSDVSVECTPLGKITKSANTANVLFVTGSNVTIKDCTIDASASTGGIVIQADSATNIQVRNNVITNSFNQAINLHAITGGSIENNKVTQNGASAGNGIVVRNGSVRIRVANNEVVMTSGTTDQADAILVAAESGQAGPKEITVTGNTLQVGVATTFGVEVGNFGGTSNPSNITVSANSILVSGSTVAGGISFALVTGGAITGNTVNANANTIIVGGIEVAVSTQIAVSGNQITGSNTTIFGIVVDQSSHCSVTGNVLNGFGNATGNAGIRVGSSTTVAAKNNIVLGNTILFGASSANVPRGIWLQSNNAGAAVDDNLVAYNVIIGNGGAATEGITLQHDSGTLARTMLSHNRIRSVNLDINRTVGATGTIIEANNAATFGGTGGTGEVISDFDLVNGQATWQNTVRPSTTGIDLGTTGARWDAFLRDTSVKRIKADAGTALVAGDFALGGNWGTTPSVGTPAATDQGGRVPVTSGSGTPGANPTLALTFKDLTWTNAPGMGYGRGDVNTPTTGYWALTSITATVATWTFVGTPTASTTYILDFTAMGR